MHGKHEVAAMIVWYWPVGHGVQSFFTYTSSSAAAQLCDAPAGVYATNLKLISVDARSNSTICQVSALLMSVPAMDHF